ncbi:uncharacterized protein LOC144265614 [Eretmochelys imbricata]
MNCSGCENPCHPPTTPPAPQFLSWGGTDLLLQWASKSAPRCLVWCSKAELEIQSDTKDLCCENCTGCVCQTSTVINYQDTCTVRDCPLPEEFTIQIGISTA